jgi:hypothetical protein
MAPIRKLGIPAAPAEPETPEQHEEATEGEFVPLGIAEAEPSRIVRVCQPHDTSSDIDAAQCEDGDSHTQKQAMDPNARCSTIHGLNLPGLEPSEPTHG